MGDRWPLSGGTLASPDGRAGVLTSELHKPLSSALNSKGRFDMGVWAWLIILAWSAALATAAHYAYFSRHTTKTDYDWTFIAGGAVIGAFTAHVWYPIAGLPVVDGLNLLQALAGGV